MRLICTCTHILILKIFRDDAVSDDLYSSIYCIAGKFGEFSESSVIRQTKTIQISTYNYNLLVESIHLLNFFSPNAQNE